MPDGRVVPSQVQARAQEQVQARALARIWQAREKATDPTFSLASHLARTLSIAALIAGFGVWLAWDASLMVWLAIPGFWVIANVFEWATHRYPMHRPAWPRVLYTKHAIHHHNAFAGAELEIRDIRELSVVMMPWYTLLIIFGGASPIAVVAGLVGGPALAGVFLVAAVAYFLFYELIHTLHHLTAAQLEHSWLGRSRMLASLRAHHHHHHQLERMTKVNFNVTFPFADRLMGTYERS